MMSTMVFNKRSPLDQTMLRYSLRSASVNFSLCKMEMNPMMPFIGVLISWLRLDRNADLSLSLSSAFNRA